jgi:hypothetical protein
MGVDIRISREEDTGIGHVEWSGEGCAEWQEVSLPSGVTTLDRKHRPSVTEDRHKRRIIAGQFSKPLIFDEALQLNIAGIAAPVAAPGLAAVAGGTINASNNIGYIAFRHKIGNTIVHESNLSPGSSVVSLDGTEQRDWTLPGSAPETRVTHVVAYVSVDGALPKEVFEKPIATATFTEDTATGALGDPPPVDVLGNLRNARGVPPYTRFVVKYHRRAWYGGDPRFPYRWWYSELDEFESVGSLNFIEHLENETITGGGSAGDQLASFGQTVSYAVQGWDESDLRIYRTSPSIGCISHFAIVNINELLYLATELGPYVYVPGAGFRPLAHRDLLTYWREEYKANPDGFDDCIADDDRIGSIYKLLVVYPTSPRSRYFIGHYQGFDPSIGDGSTLPQWTFDIRAREDSAMARLRPGPGVKRTEFFTGSCDGYVRQENVASNNDDDADTYQKKMVIEPRHFFPKGQVGDDTEACEFQYTTILLRSELSAWTLEARSGDDEAYLAGQPQWSQDVPASLETHGNLTRVAKTSHNFKLANVSGNGVTFRVTIPKAQAVQYRGLALAWGDGIQQRPFV